MRQKENLEPDKKKGLWGLVDRIEGDKVVWIIVFMLIMISWLAIFSSTSLLALETGSDRLSIMKEQAFITALGLALIWGLTISKRSASYAGSRSSVSFCHWECY